MRRRTITCAIDLRKKNIRLRQVKNSLARRVFGEIGINLPKESPYWAGNTVMAWGAGSLAELSRELDGQLKDMVKKNAKLKDSVKVKGAIVEGQIVAFEQALKMPTRQEAIASIIGMILGPASQIASQLTAVAGRRSPARSTASPRGSRSRKPRHPCGGPAR